MLKFIAALLLTALFAYTLGLYFDWWIIAVAAFVVAVCLPQRPWLAFGSGFAGLLLLWGGYSYWQSSLNQHLLAGKIAFVLPVNGNVSLLILVTALVGAMVGGFAALTGSFVWRRHQPAVK